MYPISELIMSWQAGRQARSAGQASRQAGRRAGREAGRQRGLGYSKEMRCEHEVLYSARIPGEDVLYFIMGSPFGGYPRQKRPNLQPFSTSSEKFWTARRYFRPSSADQTSSILKGDSPRLDSLLPTVKQQPAVRRGER